MKRLIGLLLTCAVLLGCLAGCGGPGERVEIITPEPTPTATPVPTPDVPVTPEVIVTTPKPEAEVVPEDVAVEIHGEENVLSMTPVDGSFAAFGGPAFRLLVDKERYQVNDVGGYCYITLRTGMSGDVYAELGFRGEERAEDIGLSILDEYGMMNKTKDLGMEELGGKRVRHLRGETVQNVFDAYLLDTERGCVTMVVSTTAETTAHFARLTASLETLEIFE